jgi:hypothetical protein
LPVKPFLAIRYSTLTAIAIFLPSVHKPLPWNVPLYFLMIYNNKIASPSPVTIGKYRIAACPRPMDGGRFVAQVSIASGRGSASTDRVMRFHDDFPSHDAAASYAMAQGIDWVHATIRTH